MYIFRKNLVAIFSQLIVLLWALPVVACDLCAIYTSLEQRELNAGSFSAGAAYQFTRYEGTPSVFAPISDVFLEEQKLDSHIIQFYAGYDVTSRFSLQATLPYIYREYDRIENGRFRSGDEHGIGDLSLLARFHAVNYKEQDMFFSWQIYGGLKLPTGEDDRLGEESESANDQDLTQLLHGVPNGNLVDGADLALGTGSFDFPLGTAFRLQKGRLFFNGDFQIALRTEGGHDFQYGHGIFFDVGPGVILHLSHEATVSLRARFSGDYKDKDELDGAELAGSDQNLLFVGGELNVTGGGSFGARVGLDFVVHDDDEITGVQADYRLLGSLSYRFHT